MENDFNENDLLDSRVVLVDKSLYEGNLTQEKIPNGPGRIEYPNGDIFEGFFIMGKKNGMGTYIKKDHFEY